MYVALYMWETIPYNWDHIALCRIMISVYLRTKPWIIALDHKVQKVCEEGCPHVNMKAVNITLTFLKIANVIVILNKALLRFTQKHYSLCDSY